MKKLIYILSIIFLSTSLYSKKQDNSINIGLMKNYEIFLNISKQETLTNWFEKLAKNRGVELKIEFFDNKNRLYKKYINSSMDTTFLSFFDFFKYENIIRKVSSEDIWTPSHTAKNEVSYCLVGKKNQKFNNFKDLKNKRLIFLQTNEVSYIWIDKNSLEDNKKPIKKIAKDISYKKKDSTVILNVYFSKGDYGIVKKSSWDTMIDLNPAIEKKLQLKKCIKNLVPYFEVFKKSLNSKTKQTFIYFLSRKLQGDDTEEFFDMFPIDHLYKVQNSDIEMMRKFYKEYLHLKEKYK